MDETRLLLSRINDLISKSYCGEHEGFGFLNELEVSVAHNYLNNLNIEHCFWGGYPSATRMFLYLKEDIKSLCDISPIKISPKGEQNLTHRDYLGSLMGLGITRECVGDILLKENEAIVFVRRDISDYILQNLSSVGNKNVKIETYTGELISLAPSFIESEVIVTSMRIDNFITSVANCSRQKANQYILSDAVFINYSCIIKPSKVLNAGDTVSIRGIGKFKIGKTLRNTKSGRLVLSVTQYK